MLKKKLPMAMFWTLIMVIWVTNEVTWFMEGNQYALPGLAFAAFGLWACVSQWRMYFEEKKQNQKTDNMGGNEK